MAYAGLATGAGAGAGLETLFARMRAEEQLKNQGRQVDLDEFNSRSLDTDRRARLGEDVRQFDAGAPVREAQVGSLNAGAAENNANAGLIEGKSGMLKGLREVTMPGMEAGPGTGEAGASAGGPSANGVSSLGSPLGRLRLSLAGLPADSIVGPVRQPDNTDEDLDAFAQKIGKTDRSQLSYDERMKGLAGRPNTVIAQGGLDIRRRDADQRQQMFDLRKRLAEKSLTELPPEVRQIAAAEFNNRITNDIKTQSWMQWFKGEEVPDPSAQIEQIAAEVMGHYGVNGPNATKPGGPGGGAGVPVPGAGDDIDEILRQRRAGQQGPPQ